MSQAKRSPPPARLSVTAHDDISRVEASLFPLIEDFSVRLEPTESFGRHVRFYSGDARIAGFPWWDYAQHDLRGWSDADIPIGTRDEPWDDLEQGWHLVIWGDDELVFVAEGDDPMCTEFRACFCVARPAYFRAWHAAIDRAKAL